MSNKVKIIIVLLAIMPINVTASCAKESTTVFSCITAKGKIIQVCDSNKTIDYSFGKSTGRPEISLKIPRELVSTTQWNGFGSSFSYSVEIPNGNTLYSVYWAAGKLMNDYSSPSTEAGVNIKINKEYVATVKCFGENKIIQNIEGINLRPTIEED